MSQKETLNLDDPWHRLQYAYENCKAKQYVEGHYGKYEDGKLSMCGIGWALHCAGWSDDKIKTPKSANILCQIKSIIDVQIPLALKEYGFPKETRRKTRNCPISECAFTGGLQRVLEHLNEYHEIPIPNIGKLIPSIRNDTTSLPTFADKCLWIKNDFIKLVLHK